MFDYRGALKTSKVYGRLNGFMPADNNYVEICDWVSGLPEIFRINMGTHLVVSKELLDDDVFNVMVEYYYSSGLVLVYFPHKYLRGM